MKITRRDLYAVTFGIAIGVYHTGAIWYGWFQATQASAPRALIDYLQGGEVTISYRNGQPFQLTLRPPDIKPEKNGKVK